MRAVQLARIAAQAEKLRLQRIARRQAIRAGCAAVAVLFMLAALGMLHVWAVIMLAKSLGYATGAVIVFAVDLLIAIILGAMAARSTPDTVEIEAKVVRDRALAQMKDGLAVASMAGLAGRLLGRKHVAGLSLGALAARFLSRRK